eukprot:PITA_10607
MGWYPVNAVNAYLETVKLCKMDVERKHPYLKKSRELESTELISALAAGINAQLIVEVSSAPSATTIALAAAARQTGGHLVCILPANAHNLQAESVEAMKELGLEDTTSFVIGGAKELLPSYKNVDFCFIDCKTQEDCLGLFKLLNINPSAAVVVANNLLDRTTTAAYESTFKKGSAKFTTLAIGKGLEVTKFGTCNLCSSPTQKGMPIIPERRCRGNKKSRWVVKVDERTGEEHVFRVGKHRDQLNRL